MIAVDTNILIYAFRIDYEQNVAVRTALDLLVESRRPWGVPWPCVHEFLANVTNRRIYSDPASLDSAFAFIDTALESPEFSLLGEGARHLELLCDLMRVGSVWGAQVHDARIAAICLAHGVSELWTADRDFLKFPKLRVRNPMMVVHER